MSQIFSTSIEFLKGVGPQRAALLQKELGIFTFGDLLQRYPFRYEDRTRFYTIAEITEAQSNVQVKGIIRTMEVAGGGPKKRLVAYFKDETGEIQLVWFKGLKWVLDKIKPGTPYIAYGKPSQYGRYISIAHPELEPVSEANLTRASLVPVYSLTEGLRNRYMDNKLIVNLQRQILQKVLAYIPETLSANILKAQGLILKRVAMEHIHFPPDPKSLARARHRLKFEEFFFIQLRILKMKLNNQEKFRGMVLENTVLVKDFYNTHLPFELTNAQKKVVRDIHRDMKSSKQMNRLLQGDVGSGKTIVAFITMLQAVGSGQQTALMAPTEILAIQHFNGLKPYADAMKLRIALLTGSTKQKDRKVIFEMLKEGTLHIIVGTHALLEDTVAFKSLGLAVVDEQHRFGVAQRSKLWRKNETLFPHMLVMTATPIPRTLAMTLYGDLDVSVIDELPAGRKPIQTIHRYDNSRLRIFGFLKEQIALGRQVYAVYPLIEESEKSDLKDLMDGYESITRAFPEVPVSIVHGKMNPADKDFEMQRFVKGNTKIMVATTVIEVGVNVPNASVMVIENAERFGLAQLHQLRGRVGRGAEQSYCILMTSHKLSKEGRVRIDTMVRTNNGFEIADVDLKLRGPGDLTGTRQSGVLDLLIADLGQDGKILETARAAAKEILDKDPDLSFPEHQPILAQVRSQSASSINWSRIS